MVSAVVRESAAAELGELGSFAFAGHAVVTLAQVAASSPTGPELRIALGDALDRASRHFSPRHCLCLTRGREGLLVTTHHDAVAGTREATRVAAYLREEIADHLFGGSGVQVGVGEPVTSLTEVHTSYRQAGLAVRVARIVSTFGPVTDYAELGVYRILASLTPSQLTPDALDAGLLALLRDGPPMMVETLEAYLDNACEASQTAASLQIHRTTLYYRLGRIQQITGADLSDGTQRLALHVGLKVARLVALYPFD